MRLCQQCRWKSLLPPILDDVIRLKSLYIRIQRYTDGLAERTDGSRITNHLLYLLESTDIAFIQTKVGNRICVSLSLCVDHRSRSPTRLQRTHVSSALIYLGEARIIPWRFPSHRNIVQSTVHRSTGKWAEIRTNKWNRLSLQSIGRILANSNEKTNHRWTPSTCTRRSITLSWILGRFEQQSRGPKGIRSALNLDYSYESPWKASYLRRRNKESLWNNHCQFVLS